MPFRHEGRVTFHDADPAGVAFFARYFVWCHDAYEALMRAGGCPLDALVRGEIGLPLANAEAEFKRPLLHGDAFTVVVKVLELKEKAFVLEHEVLTADGQVSAKLKTVHVAIARATRKTVPLPEGVLAALKPHHG
jgi:1,4-dihydroxy-2-naphthoyl-CoA hydrolase